MLGPYEWRVYSVEGIAYFAAGNLLFYFGLKCGPIVLKRAPLEKKAFRLDVGTPNFLVALSLLSLVSFAVETSMFLAYYGASFEFLGGAYHEYSEEGRTFLDQVLMCMMQFGIVSYLAWSVLDIKVSNSQRIIVFMGFWTTGCFALLQGQRFSLAAAVIVFLVVVSRRRGMRRKVRDVRRRGAFGRAVIVVALLGSSAYAFLHLMETRNTWNTPMTRYEIAVGDQWLKPEFYDLYTETGGSVKSLYEMADYMGESPYVFSGFWDSYMPDRVYLLSNTLRPIGKLLNGFGIGLIEDYEVAGEELGTPPRYAGFLWSLILDFGVYFALPAAFLFGLLFAKIDRYRGSSFLCSILYPCIFTMVFFAPCYFFYVGRLDWVVFEVLLAYAVLYIAGRKIPIRSSALEEQKGS